jgi:hypothetical protein
MFIQQPVHDVRNQDVKIYLKKKKKTVRNTFVCDRLYDRAFKPTVLFELKRENFIKMTFPHDADKNII